MNPKSMSKSRSILAGRNVFGPRWRVGVAIAALAFMPACAKRKAAATAPTASTATRPAIYSRTVAAPLDDTVRGMRDTLSEEGFGVLLEADIGANLAKFADRWGPDYNRSGLEGIRSLVFCNPRYANQAANEDPQALALCPLRLTVLHKDGESTILFARPSIAARGTGASETARVVEAKVISAIDRVAPKASVASAEGECVYDTHCRSGRVCEAHQCVRWWKLSGETPELSAEEVRALALEGKVQLLDVRTAGEYRRGHIEGAVSVPLGKLEDAAFDLPLERGVPVVAVCLTAHRSIAATRLLERRGYDIVQLAGGMRAWRSAALPETKASGEPR